nr:hypothetical protein CFP56_41318 [Quercus suber]
MGHVSVGSESLSVEFFQGGESSMQCHGGRRGSKGRGVHACVAACIVISRPESPQRIRASSAQRSKSCPEHENIHDHLLLKIRSHQASGFASSSLRKEMSITRGPARESLGADGLLRDLGGLLYFFVFRRDNLRRRRRRREGGDGTLDDRVQERCMHMMVMTRYEHSCSFDPRREIPKPRVVAGKSICWSYFLLYLMRLGNVASSHFHCMRRGVEQARGAKSPKCSSPLRTPLLRPTRSHDENIILVPLSVIVLLL